MGWWNRKQKELEAKVEEQQKQITTLETKSSHSVGYRNRWYPVVSEYFDGEKTPGEMGFYKNLIPNHDGLRYRVYEAEMKSDIVKIITGKFFKWVIGNGLKLQAEPNLTVLKTEGLNFKDLNDFQMNTEARFSVYTRSKFSDYNAMDDLHVKANDAFTTAFLGGDTLVVLRVDDKLNVNAQVIDGQHVRTPFLDQKILREIKERGNTEKHGIELSSSGEHIAFYVLLPRKNVNTFGDGGSVLGKFERIPARGEKTGRLMAWMIYGSKHRIDHQRGIPMITQILEKVEKLDRYTEATVGSAEERAKIVFAIEHSKDSDGENPLVGKARQAAGIGHNAAEETSGYQLGEKSAATIAATTSKQTFNLPIGAQLKALDSTTELQYGPFSKSVFIFLCAAIDIPPEVALQLYEQNYSSSRAAINSWDYIVKIYRQKFSKKFYQPFYNLWLEIEVVKGKITAEGYLKALRDDNFMVVEAYSTARFRGANMPHIDPLKEVKAIREMLGKNNTDPLISRELATEKLDAGDWQKNNEKYKQETDLAPEPVIVEKPVENAKKTE